MTDPCPCCGEPIDGHEQGYRPSEIETGERFFRGAAGEVYRVTRWVDEGDGTVTALEKAPAEDAANEGDGDA